MRVIYSIWLRLTFQFTFKYKIDRELTSIIQEMLTIGIKGYLLTDDNRINVLLADQTVVSVNDDHRFNNWLSNGQWGTKDGTKYLWEGARPNIIEIYKLYKALVKIKPL